MSPSKDTFFVFDPFTGKAITWNRAFTEVSGYSDEEIATMKAPDSWYSEEDLKRATGIVDTIFSKGFGTIDMSLITKCGESIPYEYTGVRIEGNNGHRPCIIAVGRNLDEYRKREMALRESEARFRTAIESLPFDLFCLDREQRCTIQNTISKNWWGRIIGKRPEDIAPDEDTLSVWKENNRRVLNGETIRGEVSMTVKDERRRFYNIISPILEDDMIAGILGMNIDITQQKQMEERLHHAEKMEAIGQLASGIAHDFNNQLGMILSCVELMLFKPGDEAHVRRNANNIIRTAERAADLTSKLLTFAREGSVGNKAVNLHHLIEEVAGMLERTVGGQISVKQHLGARVPMTSGDASQLQNALLNLGLNARDAMPNGGDLTFATNIRTLDENACAELSPHIEPGEYLQISVTDTGVGMDEQTESRIFEPFFTTKGLGKGTGMGLAAVYGTVTGHGGAVAVNSVPGKGSTFRIYLPIFEKSAEAVSGSVHEVAVRGKAIILLVDDDDFYRQIAVSSLEALDYRVNACGSGKQAVDLFNESWHEIDLVILDMVMPGMNGYDTFFALREINPTVPILIASAYAINEKTQEAIDSGVAGYIQKPFDVEVLIRKISSLLDCDAVMN